MANDLQNYAFYSRDFINTSERTNGATDIGENARQFGQLALDLESIAASVAGKANPFCRSESESQGPLSLEVFYDHVDLDLGMALSYRQANSFDARKLRGTVIMEDGTEFDFT